MKNFLISNANIFRPDYKFQKGDIKISNGIIVDELNDDYEIIDAENLFVIPGLTDIHFHGCAGHDFCEGTEEAFKAILDYEKSIGVTTMSPATMTLPIQKLIQIIGEAKNFGNFSGIYLEGPFISKLKIGAQNPKYISKPDTEILEKFRGFIKIAVIAPEVEGGFEFIEDAKNITRLSLGHSNSNYETAAKAFNSGVSQVTHLYNAINPINHREPGAIIAAMENENVKVELICDGVHIHPAIVKNTIKIFGDDRVIFISDSMEATGMPDGEYELGGQKVIKTGNKAMLEDGKTIAGSVTNLFDCMKNSVLNMNVKLETAVKCAAVNSAKAIGIYENYGSIEAGKTANLIALDKNLNRVWVLS